MSQKRYDEALKQQFEGHPASTGIPSHGVRIHVDKMLGSKSRWVRL